jgi:hypothetical protein
MKRLYYRVHSPYSRFLNPGTVHTTSPSLGYIYKADKRKTCEIHLFPHMIVQLLWFCLQVALVSCKCHSIWPNPLDFQALLALVQDALCRLGRAGLQWRVQAIPSARIGSLALWFLSPNWVLFKRSILRMWYHFNKTIWLLIWDSMRTFCSISGPLLYYVQKQTVCPNHFFSNQTLIFYYVICSNVFPIRGLYKGIVHGARYRDTGTASAQCQNHIGWCRNIIYSFTMGIEVFVFFLHLFYIISDHLCFW